MSFDFKKAFDAMSHQKLLIKLQAYGISDNLLSWLEAFLSYRTQAVKVNGHLSNSGDVISGVSRGIVPGPMLSLIFINDVTDTPGWTNNSVKFKLFADEFKLKLQIVIPSELLLTDCNQRINAVDQQMAITAHEKCIQISIKT